MSDLVGPTGATGAPGGQDASENKWIPLQMSLPVSAGDVPPACTADPQGSAYFRGHINLDPVPATGGQLLVVLPYDAATNSCPCTPGGGVPGANPWIGTTTALIERTNVAPFVCIVRVTMTTDVPYDVNQDGLISVDDILAVQSAPQGPCDPCGRADVDHDFTVDSKDVAAIINILPLPANVTCGVVWASAFTCASQYGIDATYDNARDRKSVV